MLMPGNNTSYRNLVRRMYVETPHCSLMFVMYVYKQTEIFARHACHHAHWLERCGMVSGFASSCMSARNDAQNDASRVQFLFEIQLISKPTHHKKKPRRGSRTKRSAA